MSGLDRRIQLWIVHHRAEPFDSLFRAVSFAATSGAVFLVVALVVSLRRRRPRVIVTVALADGLAVLLGWAARQAVGRPRPSAGAVPPPLVHIPGGPALPSGHASAAFACATALALAVPRLAFPLFLFAAAVG